MRILLREYPDVRGEPPSERSFSANLLNFAESRTSAMTADDVIGASHASRGIAESYRRLGRLDESEREYKHAVQVFTAASDPNGAAWSLFGLGNLLRQKSDFARAYSILTQALALACESRDDGLIAYIRASIAETRRIQGDYGRAYSEHVQVRRLFVRLHDLRGEIWALEGIGQILRHLGYLDKAFAHFAEAKHLAATAGDSRGLAYALKCCAESSAARGDRFAAIDEVQLAIAMFDGIGLKVGLAYSYKALGDILRRGGDQAAALAGYRLAINVFEDIRDARGIAYTMNSIAAMHLDVGECLRAASILSYSSLYFSRKQIFLGYGETRRLFKRLTDNRLLTGANLKELSVAARAGYLPLRDFGFKTLEILRAA